MAVASGEVVDNQFYVDIGAQDGVLGSQSLGFAKKGWAGVCYEADPELCEVMSSLYGSMPDVKIRQGFITPENVCDLLSRDGVPENFGFLNLDVDSYDYFILESLLNKYSPQVICVEINEIIPPPIKFAVKYFPEIVWSGDNFQGFSIQIAKVICEKYGYAINQLHYNNLILVKRDNVSIDDKSIEEIYDAGYKNRPGRKEHFIHNRDHEQILDMEKDKAFEYIQDLFKENIEYCVLEA